MSTENIKYQNLLKECGFSSSRSQGPGGQNVNKVNSKVELRFNVVNSEFLTEQEKKRLMFKLKNRISKDADLIVYSQQYRTQSLNKEDVKEKFLKLIIESLTRPKKRIPTRISKSSIEKRITNKKKLSQKKLNRGKISDL